MSQSKLTFEDLPKAVEILIQEILDLKEIIRDMESRDTERFITIDEASKVLGLEKSTIYKKVSNREIPFTKKGGTLYFSNTELTEYLKNGRKHTATELSTINYLRK